MTRFLVFTVLPTVVAVACGFAAVNAMGDTGAAIETHQVGALIWAFSAGIWTVNALNGLLRFLWD